jgi:hypothetical protein
MGSSLSEMGKFTNSFVACETPTNSDLKMSNED